jgi:tetratricopeptide (TPR) repeat protein
MLQQEGVHAEAIEKFERVLEIKPDNVKTLYHLAFSLSELEQNDRAEELLNKAIEHNPRYFEAYIELGLIAGKKNNFRKALDIYKRASQYAIDKTEIYHIIASTHNIMGEYKEAAEYYKMVTESCQDHLEAYIGYAIALNELGEVKEAVRKVRRAYQLAPNSDKVNVIYGMILLKDEKTVREALEKFEKALAVDRNNMSALIGKGEALLKLKRTDEAMLAFNEVVLKESDSLQAWYMKGVAYREKIEETGKEEFYEKAVECYKKVLEFQPSHLGALGDIAYLQAKKGDFEAFKAEFNRMCAAYPRQKQAIADMFGKYLARLGSELTVEDLYASTPEQTTSGEG